MQARRIEKACKDASGQILDEPLFICNFDEVFPSEILEEKRIYIANHEIFYCLSGSMVHEIAISNIEDACRLALENETN